MEEKFLLKLNDHDHEISSLKHRVDKCEEQQSTINSLAISVNKLANNMETMLKEQEEQRKDINALMDAPVQDFKYYKRVVISCVITGILGTVLGGVLSLIMR